MATTKAPQGAHRNLHVVSSLMRGPDVKGLQQAINHELHHRKLGWRCLKVDGQFGKRTLVACRFLAWVLGLNAKRLRVMSGPKAHVSIEVQRLLRNPEERGRLDRVREDRRKNAVQALRHAHDTGPQAAIAYIRQKAAEDVHEIGESNRGPDVDRWERFFGLLGLAWCGMLAGYAAIVIGKCVAKGLSFWNGYALIQEAAEHKDGCYPVPFDEIEGGEILVLWGGEHVVTAAAAPKDNTVETGEGNTSPNPGGDQANGGSVEMKKRSRSDVTVAIRIYG